MATISTSGITVGAIIKSEHVLRIINALNGTDPIDIIVKGSLSTSGSLNVTGSTFLKGLPNTSRANVITYDPTTGQLSYLASASLGVTMSVSQPGGSNTQIQYNSGSVLAGNSNFKFIYNSSSLTLGDSTPTGLYSFTQGSSLTATGNYSHAQGSLTKATNTSAHAEGDTTIALGIGSHAEGNFTSASNNYSHAEGQYTLASGIGSHAEGTYTTASGDYSHAEGNNTEARGEKSHAEGYDTLASGSHSHAEGNSTIALGNYQHVQGQYNITSSAESAFIIGNGTADNARRNLVFASGSTFQITGSLLVSGSITGSIFGTASFAQDAFNVVHRTGDESITGKKSFGGTASTKIEITSGDGYGVFAATIAGNTGSNFYSQNRGTGIGIFADTTVGDSIVSSGAGTGRVFVGQNAGSTTLTIDRYGNISSRGSGSFENNLTVTGSTSILGPLTINGSSTIVANAPTLLLTRGNGDSSIQLNTGDTTLGSSGSLTYFGSQFLKIDSNTGIKLSTTNKERITISNDGGIIINSGSQATAPTVLQVTGSVSISDILTLTPRSTTPGSPTNGMTIISGSGADQHIYCYLNSTWKQLD